jgi:ribonucleoside-diphosphate reductase alpha chain
MSDEEEALTRVISWGLRHGGGIKFVTEQLNKTKGDMTSFSKSIARTLKKYIKNGEKVGTVCPVCGSDNVVYKDGCEICLACGNEKCG